MPKQMLTANRLRDGAVLYWKGGAWAEGLRDGDVFEDQAAADAALAEAHAFVAKNEVVNPYLFDVTADGAPVKEREIIRALGPSVRGANLRKEGGKQAPAPAPVPEDPYNVSI